MSAPLGQKLQSSERQVKKLPVFLIGLLTVQPWSSHHLTVTVARQLRDEADVVISDLHHLLAQVILWTDAALSAGPPERERERKKDATKKMYT